MKKSKGTKVEVSKHLQLKALLAAQTREDNDREKQVEQACQRRKKQDESRRFF